MRRPFIPSALRRRIADQAAHRCGYCLTSESLVGTDLEIDHLLPLSRGGGTDEANLWLACAGCNDIKSTRSYGYDEQSGRSVRLFNPRFQSWSRHFEWIDGGLRVRGKTAAGRATVETLKLNRPALIRSRQYWIAAGWHPPVD